MTNNSESVPALIPDEQSALDERGFVLLRDVLDASALDATRTAFEDVVGPEPAAAGRDSGTRHAEKLEGRHPDLDVARSHPRVLGGVEHVLQRPFQVLVFGARDPQRGYGLQGLHADWMPRAPGEPFAVATALWLLDEFTVTNGATRVVPGSHRMPRPPAKSFTLPEAHHPEEELVLGPAGSVLLFNGHLWHSGTRNTSHSPRRVLQVQFVARGLVPDR